MSVSNFCNSVIKHRFSLLKIVVCSILILNLITLGVNNQNLRTKIKTLEALNQKCNTNEDDKKNGVVDVHKEKIVEKSEIKLEYSQRKYYPFIYNLPNKCKDQNGNPEPILLLVVIKSITSQFDRRQSIRLTWGNEDNIPGIKFKRIFLLARSQDSKKEALLAEEVAEYQDIIQGDFVDSFRNLTIKDIMFLRWMITYCGHVKYIFKGDDDVFVNMNNIVDYILSLSSQQSRNLFAGSVLYPSPRITDPKSKYYVSSNLWPEKYYPPYVSGGGFVMSSLMAKKIFEVIKITPIIPIDDAFMGVCLKKLGIKPQNHKGFKSWGVNRRKDVCVYREIMTLHKLNSDEMKEMWKKMKDSDFSECALLVETNNLTKKIDNR